MQNYYFYRFFTLLFLSMTSFGLTVDYEKIETCRHCFSIGPQFYHLERVRKGGTYQTGYLYGVRFNYEYSGRYLIYYGLEAAYATTQDLNGKNPLKESLKSHFADHMIEARLGYTFQSKTAACGSFTPYIAVGYFLEKNNYVKPSSTHYHFTNKFKYGSIGALSKAYLTPKLTIGLNVAALFSLEGHVKITHDPKYGKTTLDYENKIHARIALPCCYSQIDSPFLTSYFNQQIALIPFFEYRHYGHHPQVPFDFLKTEIKIYGAEVRYTLCF